MMPRPSELPRWRLRDTMWPGLVVVEVKKWLRWREIGRLFAVPGGWIAKDGQDRIGVYDTHLEAGKQVFVRWSSRIGG